MAFHPYPQLIQAVFNQHWFGPPLGVTLASSWPRIDQHASRPNTTHLTPYSDSLSLRLHRLCGLTLRVAFTSRLIMQKARGQTYSPPTACKHTVSGSISLRLQRFFSPFPHGTSSLSVACEYLALGDGPPRFMQGSSYPALLGCRTGV